VIDKKGKRVIQRIEGQTYIHLQYTLVQMRIDDADATCIDAMHMAWYDMASWLAWLDAMHLVSVF
jgi:hypothetical protein